MAERLFVLGISAYRPKLMLGKGGARREFDIPIGVTCGWAESPAIAKEAALSLVKREMPEEAGYRQHEAAVREIPTSRLEEWALRSGWTSPEETARLRAEIARLKKKRRGREWVESDDESEVLV